MDRDALAFLVVALDAWLSPDGANPAPACAPLADLRAALADVLSDHVATLRSPDGLARAMDRHERWASAFRVVAGACDVPRSEHAVFVGAALAALDDGLTALRRALVAARPHQWRDRAARLARHRRLHDALARYGAALDRALGDGAPAATRAADALAEAVQ